MKKLAACYNAKNCESLIRMLGAAVGGWAIDHEVPIPTAIAAMGWGNVNLPQKLYDHVSMHAGDYVMLGLRNELFFSDCSKHAEQRYRTMMDTCLNEAAGDLVVVMPEGYEERKARRKQLGMFKL